MSLANMRESYGIAALDVTCGACGHRGFVDVTPYADTVPVQAFRAVLRCIACGGRPIDVRPCWQDAEVGQWQQAARAAGSPLTHPRR